MTDTRPVDRDGQQNDERRRDSVPESAPRARGPVSAAERQEALRRLQEIAPIIFPEPQEQIKATGSIDDLTFYMQEVARIKRTSENEEEQDQCWWAWEKSGVIILPQGTEESARLARPGERTNTPRNKAEERARAKQLIIYLSLKSLNEWAEKRRSLLAKAQGGTTTEQARRKAELEIIQQIEVISWVVWHEGITGAAIEARGAELREHGEAGQVLGRQEIFGEREAKQTNFLIYDPLTGGRARVEDFEMPGRAGRVHLDALFNPDKSPYFAAGMKALYGLTPEQIDATSAPGLTDGIKEAAKVLNRLVAKTVPGGQEGLSFEQAQVLFEKMAPKDILAQNIAAATEGYGRAALRHFQRDGTRSFPGEESQGEFVETLKVTDRVRKDVEKRLDRVATALEKENKRLGLHDEESGEETALGRLKKKRGEYPETMEKTYFDFQRLLEIKETIEKAMTKGIGELLGPRVLAEKAMESLATVIHRPAVASFIKIKEIMAKGREFDFIAGVDEWEEYREGNGELQKRRRSRKGELEIAREERDRLLLGDNTVIREQTETRNALYGGGKEIGVWERIAEVKSRAFSYEADLRRRAESRLLAEGKERTPELMTETIEQMWATDTRPAEIRAALDFVVAMEEIKQQDGKITTLSIRANQRTISAEDSQKLLALGEAREPLETQILAIREKAIYKRLGADEIVKLRRLERESTRIQQELALFRRALCRPLRRGEEPSKEISAGEAQAARTELAEAQAERGRLLNGLRERNGFYAGLLDQKERLEERLISLEGIITEAMPVLPRPRFCTRAYFAQQYVEQLEKREAYLRERVLPGRRGDGPITVYQWGETGKIVREEVFLDQGISFYDLEERKERQKIAAFGFSKEEEEEAENLADIVRTVSGLETYGSWTDPAIKGISYDHPDAVIRKAAYTQRQRGLQEHIPKFWDAAKISAATRLLRFSPKGANFGLKTMFEDDQSFLATLWKNVGAVDAKGKFLEEAIDLATLTLDGILIGEMAEGAKDALSDFLRKETSAEEARGKLAGAMERAESGVFSIEEANEVAKAFSFSSPKDNQEMKDFLLTLAEPSLLMMVASQRGDPNLARAMEAQMRVKGAFDSRLRECYFKPLGINSFEDLKSPDSAEKRAQLILLLLYKQNREVLKRGGLEIREGEILEDFLERNYEEGTVTLIDLMAAAGMVEEVDGITGEKRLRADKREADLLLTDKIFRDLREHNPNQIKAIASACDTESIRRQLINQGLLSPGQKVADWLLYLSGPLPAIIADVLELRRLVLERKMEIQSKVLMDPTENNLFAVDDYLDLHRLFGEVLLNSRWVNLHGLDGNLYKKFRVHGALEESCEFAYGALKGLRVFSEDGDILAHTYIGDDMKKATELPQEGKESTRHARVWGYGEPRIPLLYDIAEHTWEARKEAFLDEDPSLNAYTPLDIDKLTKIAALMPKDGGLAITGVFYKNMREQLLGQKLLPIPEDWERWRLIGGLLNVLSFLPAERYVQLWELRKNLNGLWGDKKEQVASVTTQLEAAVKQGLGGVVKMIPVIGGTLAERLPFSPDFPTALFWSVALASVPTWFGGAAIGPLSQAGIEAVMNLDLVSAAGNLLGGIGAHGPTAKEFADGVVSLFGQPGVLIGLLAAQGLMREHIFKNLAKLDIPNQIRLPAYGLLFGLPVAAALPAVAPIAFLAGVGLGVIAGGKCWDAAVDPARIMQGVKAQVDAFGEKVR